MRFIAFLVLTMAVFPALAQAQDTTQPLYNSSGNATAGAPLYNKGTAGVQPLSIKQIMEGKNTSGYTYNYDNTTSYRPYGAGGNPTFPSLDQVEAFRARQAAEAQEREQLAMQDLSQQVQQQQQVNGIPGAQALTEGLQTLIPQEEQKKKKMRYKGRDLGITIPPKVFNSVR